MRGFVKRRQVFGHIVIGEMPSRRTFQMKVIRIIVHVQGKPKKKLAQVKTLHSLASMFPTGLSGALNVTVFCLKADIHQLFMIHHHYYYNYYYFVI